MFCSGSHTPVGGDYTFRVNGAYYRLLFSGDKLILSHGDEAALKEALAALQIIK